MYNFPQKLYMTKKTRIFFKFSIHDIYVVQLIDKFVNHWLILKNQSLCALLSPFNRYTFLIHVFMGSLGPLMLAYSLVNPRMKKLRYAETKLAIG